MKLAFDTNRSLSPSLQPAFDGQRFESLLQLLPEKTQKPDLALHLHRIDGGYFTIDPGRDGIIFTSDGTPIRETCLFGRPPVPDRARLEQSSITLDFNPIVVIDCAWRNYYHWLCLALPKLLLSQRIAGLDARPVIPNYDDHTALGWSIAFSRTVWQQSLDMSGLTGRVQRLRPGIYRADAIYTLWLDDKEPALFPYLTDFDRVYEPMRHQLVRDAALPRRVLIARRLDQRLSGPEAAAIEAVADAYGFTRIYLEDMDLREQAQLFFNAEAVIAPHGAGLSNLVFAPASLRVLELNRCIGGDPCLRPWFYLIAAARGQTYFHLDGSAGQFTRAHLDAAIDRLCSRLPSDVAAPWWSIAPDSPARRAG